jgi:hypothetical protein
VTIHRTIPPGHPVLANWISPILPPNDPLPIFSVIRRRFRDIFAGFAIPKVGLQKLPKGNFIAIEAHLCYFSRGIRSLMKTSNLLPIPHLARLFAAVLVASLLAITSARADHTLVAHYTFDDSGFLGEDTSGNGNDLDCLTYWGPQLYWTNNAEAGGGAVRFVGTSSLDACGATFTTWTNTLNGSFSVSAWIKTTNVIGGDGDSLAYGSDSAVIFAENGADGVIPIGFTGRKVGFYTSGTDDTLHSSTTVTTGQYVHVVVTRNETNGMKQIYINGNLDASDIGSTGRLILTTNTTFASVGGYVPFGFTGEADEVQLYSGILNPAEVTYLFNNPGSNAPNITVASSGLVAHYTFDDSSNLGADNSGNGNDITYISGYNGGNVAFNTNAIAGGGAVSFNNNGGVGGGILSWNSTPTNLLSAFAGSFTVSCWIKTTNNFGSQYDYAYNGAGIISADVPGAANDVVPLALTDGQAAFNVGDPMNGDVTLNSADVVSDGQYHHVAVTRFQPTGEMDIYIDGQADENDPDFGSTNSLTAPVLLTIGAISDASNPNPNTTDYYNGYSGLLDDLQVYSFALTPGQIGQLYGNPGETLALAPTTAALVAHYTFDDTNFAGQDSSGNGNDVYCSTSWGPGYYSTNDAIAGGGAIDFAGGSSLDVCESAFTTWTNTFNGSFSVSVWVKTTHVVGSDSDDLVAAGDPGVIFAENQGDGVIPVGITGHKAAFYTSVAADTLHSSTNVTTGNYTHVVVTRDANTGAKQIFINGVLDASDYGSAGPLETNADFASIGGYVPVGYTGLADDVQIYSGVLTAAQVAYLHAFPGQTAPTGASPVPVTLLNPMVSGAEITFSFVSESGHSHTVQYNTNLTTGTGWQTFSSIPGDGTTKDVSIPIPVNGSHQAFFRVTTQ